VKWKNPRWWICYHTPESQRRKVKGYKDRKATEAVAAELEKWGERLASGMADPLDDHAKRPLAEHLTGVRAVPGRQGEHRQARPLKTSRVQACLDAAHFVKLADVQPSGVFSFFLADLRAKGASIPTANHSLTCIKRFACWLWKDK
jgi:hypothetical protein